MASKVVIVPMDFSIPALSFDMTRSEQHAWETEITDSPLESGATANDHAIHKPDKFTCTVTTSNTPLGRTWDNQGRMQPIILQLPGYPPTITAAGVSRPTPGRAQQALALMVDAPTDRVREALEKLNELRLRVQTLIVFTAVWEYVQMVLTKIELPLERTSQSGDFTLTFERLEIVTTDQVTAPAPKEARGAPAVSKGPVGDPTKEAVDAGFQRFNDYAQGKRSVLRDVVKGIFG